jgi:vacuolar-type H+-ATPase catalytic subunit A/Vma1
MSDSMDTDLPELALAGDDAAHDSRPFNAVGAGAAIATSTSSDVALFAERARFIPMRLDLEERRHFRLLEAALSVSEYTDKVDILMWKNKTARIVEQVKDICSILSGLKVAQVRMMIMLCLVRRQV